MTQDEKRRPIDPIEERDIDKVLALLDVQEVREKIVEILWTEREELAQLIMDVAPYAVAEQMNGGEVLQVVDYIKQHVQPNRINNK